MGAVILGAANHDDMLAPHAPERRRIEGAGTPEDRWRNSSIAHLPICDIADWTERFRRIWLVAPHPDDEILAVGGALAALSARGADIRVVSVTDGEASHVRSQVWTRERLARERPAESLRSMKLLGIAAPVVRLGLPDGRVNAHRQSLLRSLAELLDEDDLVLTTCSFDGHPDHEACGEVAALAAEMSGATLIAYPVWLWHWAQPDEGIVPWGQAQRIPIPEEILERKREALGAFVSQITPDGPREAVLPPHVLERFLRGFEVVFTRA